MEIGVCVVLYVGDIDYIVCVEEFGYSYVWCVDL